MEDILIAETIEKWVIDHIEFVTKPNSDLVLPEVPKEKGRGGVRTLVVDVPRGQKIRQHGRGLVAGKRLKKGISRRIYFKRSSLVL